MVSSREIVELSFLMVEKSLQCLLKLSPSPQGNLIHKNVSYNSENFIFE